MSCLPLGSVRQIRDNSSLVDSLVERIWGFCDRDVSHGGFLSPTGTHAVAINKRHLDSRSAETAVSVLGGSYLSLLCYYVSYSGRVGYRSACYSDLNLCKCVTL